MPVSRQRMHFLRFNLISVGEFHFISFVLIWKNYQLEGNFSEKQVERWKNSISSQMALCIEIDDSGVETRINRKTHKRQQ